MSQPRDDGYPGDCPHASAPGWCPACVAKLIADRDHQQQNYRSVSEWAQGLLLQRDHFRDRAIANGAALEAICRPAQQALRRSEQTSQR